MTRAETLEQESRWALPVAIATLLAVALIIASGFVNSVSGDGAAEVLRSVEENKGSVMLSSLMQAAAFALLVFPLVYLFRAARARSERVRGQLIGLVVVAPLFLAVAAGLLGVAQQEAADEFVAGKVEPTLSRADAKEECVEEREEDGNDHLVDEYDPVKGESPLKACEERKLEDDAASEARTDASVAPMALGLQIGGALGFVVAIFYTCLWAMRTGLLTRFWGSLGMALGIATLLGLLPFLLVWLLYVAFMFLGFVPGGKPPAWEAGEAIPWPTPGERAAAELEPEDGWDEADEQGEDPGEDGAPKRKRKQRE